MAKYLYRFYSEQNLAETWRDADDIHTEEIAYFTTRKKAKEFVIDFLRKELNYVVDNCGFDEEYRRKQHKETEETLSKLKIKFNENNEWWWTSGGSWAVYYCLKKVELNNQLDK
jgi:hypothetical protein